MQYEDASCIGFLIWGKQYEHLSSEDIKLKYHSWILFSFNEVFPVSAQYGAFLWGHYW